MPNPSEEQLSDDFGEDEIFFGQLSLKELKRQKHILCNNHTHSKSSASCVGTPDYNTIKIIETHSQPNLRQIIDRSPKFSSVPASPVLLNRKSEDSFIQIENMVEESVNQCLSLGKRESLELNNTLEVIEYILNNGPKQDTYLSETEHKDDKEKHGFQSLLPSERSSPSSKPKQKTYLSEAAPKNEEKNHGFQSPLHLKKSSPASKPSPEQETILFETAYKDNEEKHGFHSLLPTETSSPSSKSSSKQKTYLSETAHKNEEEKQGFQSPLSFKRSSPASKPSPKQETYLFETAYKDSEEKHGFQSPMPSITSPSCYKLSPKKETYLSKPMHKDEEEKYGFQSPFPSKTTHQTTPQKTIEKTVTKSPRYLTPIRSTKKEQDDVFVTPSSTIFKAKTTTFKTPANPLSQKKPLVSPMRKTPSKTNAFQHITSPVASYINKCPQVLLVKTVHPKKPLPGPSSIPKYVHNPLHSKLQNKENINLPSIAYKRAKETKVINLPDEEKLPQSQWAKKLTSTLPRPTVMKHESREINLLNKVSINSQEDSFVNLACAQAEVSVCTQKTAFKTSKQ